MIGNSQGIFETSYKDEIARVSMGFLKLSCYVVQMQQNICHCIDFFG